MKGRVKGYLAGTMLALSVTLAAPTGELAPQVEAAQTTVVSAGTTQNVKAAATKAQLKKTKVTMKKGEGMSVEFKKTQKGAKYTWKSSKPAVVSVSAKGMLAAKKDGKATITCTVKPKSGKTYKLTQVVTVKGNAVKASLKEKKTTIKQRQKKTIAFKTKQKGASYTWKSSKTSVVSVSSKGVLTGKKEGTATITCTVKPAFGKNYNLKLNVTVKGKILTEEEKRAEEEKRRAEEEKRRAEEEARRIAEEEAKKTVVAEQTKIIDLGFVQYVAITYKDGYNKDNTRTIVDGVDVSNAVTAVSDDGSVAKWEITTLNPGSVTVISKSDSKKSQTVKLSNNKNPQKPVVKKGTAPDYVMGYASVPYWDYYLTNYDDNGNVRVSAGKTTFAKNGKATKKEHPYYSPDADVTGNVIIMFNYSTEDEQNWFDAIAKEGALELVSYDENKTVINSHLNYEKSLEPHGNNTVGQFTVPVGQSNFTNAGRYYVRIRPASGNAVLVPVHVVNEKAPKMTLSENRALQSGQNIHFKMEGMAYGIKDPVENVTLKKPDGKVETLKFIDDYFLFGDLFVLYNDVTRDDNKGINHTAQAGVYTITVKAEGFKETSATFRIVSDGSNVSASTKVKTGYDAVTSATGGSVGTGESGSGSGGGSVSANLIFNVDLYANAEIFDKLGHKNADATAIVDRYETEIVNMTAAYTKDGKVFYDFYDYYNAVQNAAVKGTYLTFSDYVNSADPKTVNKPSKVKEVLEDNLLGELIEDNSYYGYEAPELKLIDSEGNTIETVTEGNDAFYTVADEKDADYIKAIEGVYTEDSWYTPLTEGWKVEDGRLVIQASLLSLTGDNTFTVRAPGYKDVTVKVPYTKALENITPELNGDAVVGQDVIVTLTGSEGDFAKYMTNVTLNDGKKDKNVLTASAGGTSKNDWYEWNEAKTELTLKAGLFKRAGQYTLTLAAEYYDDVVLNFNVEQAEDDANAAAAPKAVKVTSSGNTYLVAFEDADAATYLSKLDEYGVIVGETEYTKALLSTGSTSFQVVSDPVNGGARNMLKLGKGGFNTEEATEVTLRVAGYQTQSFTILADGTLEGAEPEPEEPEVNPVNPETGKKDAPGVTPSIHYNSGAGIFQIQSQDASFMKWLSEIVVDTTTKVTVNGTIFNYDKNTWNASSYGVKNAWIKGESSFVLTKAGMISGQENIVTIETKDYKPVIWNVNFTTDYYGNTSDITLTQGQSEEEKVEESKKAVPAATPSFEFVSSSYLQLSSYDSEYTEWLGAISEATKVTVNGKEISYSSNAWYGGSGSESNWVKGSTSIVLTPQGFTEGDNIVTIDAEGYETMTWHFKVTKNYYSGTTIEFVK